MSLSETVETRRALRLRAEFLLFYVGVPVAVAVALPARQMFPALFAMTALGILLLWRTEGFRWRELIAGRIDLPQAALLSVIVAAVSYAVLSAREPEALFFLARERPELLAMIWVFYPVVSALPQELIFRPLFFRRYGAVLPEGRGAIVLNAAVFSLAHLMYWSPVVAVMTFGGGLVFAWVYEAKRSFPQAVLLHALAGNILFAIGMGVYFYSGNVVRPF